MSGALRAISRMPRISISGLPKEAMGKYPHDTGCRFQGAKVRLMTKDSMMAFQLGNSLHAKGLPREPAEQLLRPELRDYYQTDLKLGMLSAIWNGEVWRPLTSSLLHVNLIRYNATANPTQYRKPSHSTVERFQAILTQNKVHHTMRQDFGTDIQAACGQLAANYKTN